MALHIAAPFVGRDRCLEGFFPDSYYQRMDLTRICVVVNAAKPGAGHAQEILSAWARQRRIETVLLDKPLPPDTATAACIVLAMGGDGTVLRAAAWVGALGIPILGINLGSLGFLTQASIGQLVHALEQILDDDFAIEERMRLLYEANGVSGTVLNDLVIQGVTESRFCELELSWGDGVVTSYPGDGLIVSTATGSTAYSLSAGGPVIVPPAACILATPLAAHRLGVRPVIFPADETLRVVARTPVRLIADGDPAGHLPRTAVVRVTRAAEPSRLLRPATAPSFFDVLDEKLNWADSSPRENGA